jgi:hypothetical protein
MCLPFAPAVLCLLIGSRHSLTAKNGKEPPNDLNPTPSCPPYLRSSNRPWSLAIARARGRTGTELQNRVDPCHHRRVAVYQHSVAEKTVHHLHHVAAVKDKLILCIEPTIV